MGLVARLFPRFRHHEEVIVFGYHWRYCNHWSHKWNLRCWRWSIWDEYYPKHNDKCWAVHG